MRVCLYVSVDSNYGIFSKRGKMGTLHTKQQRQLFSVPLLTFSGANWPGCLPFCHCPEAQAEFAKSVFQVPITPGAGGGGGVGLSRWSDSFLCINEKLRFYELVTYHLGEIFKGNSSRN